MHDCIYRATLDVFILDATFDDDTFNYSEQLDRSRKELSMPKNEVWLILNTCKYGVELIYFLLEMPSKYLYSIYIYTY